MQALAYQVPVRRETPVGTIIFAHVLLGLVSFFIPAIPIIYGLIFFIYALLRIVQTRNKTNLAAFASAYIVGYEILVRMSGVSVAYEFGKYAAIILLITGMLTEHTERKLPTSALLYFALLIPSIFVIKITSYHTFRTDISFNLSGPLSLSVSWFYFYQRKINKEGFRKLVLYSILPVIAIVVFILLKIPSNKDFSLTTGSAKDMSGGFGPNQVSMLLGYGFFIITLAVLLGQTITQNKTMDAVIGIIFLSFAILTYSRGGAIVGILSVIGAGIIFFRSGKSSKKMARLFYGAVFFGVALYATWQFVNSFTGNSIERRYSETVNIKEGHQSEGGIDFSGRDALVLYDLQAFSQHPILGNGPEGSEHFRKYYYGSGLTAHTEFSRLLGDHGIFGLFAIIILFSNIYLTFKRARGNSKITLTGFACIGILNMLHGAMRLAMIGYSVGVAFMDVDIEDHPMEKKLN
jgi:hypothetical protein